MIDRRLVDRVRRWLRQFPAVGLLGPRQCGKSTLAQTYLVRVLLPSEANVKKRLVKTPKVYLRDSGLLPTLLGIETLAKGYPLGDGVEVTPLPGLLAAVAARK
jgi:predicted AAA+ superfamily ATPase